MKKALIYIVLFAGFLQACTEPIEFNLGEQGEPRVTIDAIIDNLPSQDTIVIRKTTSFYEPATNDFVTDAVVEITMPNGSTVTFDHLANMPGRYVSPNGFAANPGGTYTMSVIVDGKAYTSTETMPLVVEPDTAYLIENPDLFFDPDDNEIDLGDRWYSFKVSFQEPVGVQNFFFLRYIINGDDRSDNLADYAGYVEDTFFKDEYLSNVDLGALYLFPEDSVDFYFGSINKNGYEIWQALVEESEFRGGFFDGPPANVPTNFDNGALGLFMPVAYATRVVVAP